MYSNSITALIEESFRYHILEEFDKGPERPKKSKKPVKPKKKPGFIKNNYNKISKSKFGKGFGRGLRSTASVITGKIDPKRIRDKETRTIYNDLDKEIKKNQKILAKNKKNLYSVRANTDQAYANNLYKDMDIARENISNFKGNRASLGRMAGLNNLTGATFGSGVGGAAKAGAATPGLAGAAGVGLLGYEGIKHLMD